MSEKKEFFIGLDAKEVLFDDGDTARLAYDSKPDFEETIHVIDMESYCRLEAAYKVLREALSFDYEYYEAKPHKCLSLLNELKEAIQKAEELLK